MALLISLTDSSIGRSALIDESEGPGVFVLTLLEPARRPSRTRRYPTDQERAVSLAQALADALHHLEVQP